MSHPAPAPSTVRVGSPAELAGMAERRDGVAPPPAVVVMLDRVDNNLNALAVDLDALTARLAGVLGSGTPHATPGYGGEPATLAGDSPVVERLTAFENRVASLGAQVNGLLNRLEL